MCIADEVPFEIPESWEWARISTVFTLQAGKNIQASDISESIFDGSYLCYGGNGVRGYVKSYNREGDYPIIGRQGALCGNIKYAKGKFYATEHAVCVETFAQTNVEWACAFLEALNLNQYATATAQPGLAVANIKNILIPIPPNNEQQRIVDVLISLQPFIEAYTQKECELDSLNQQFSDLLKKSLLQEAVQGNLVSQDPADEPASALLERIRTEKEQLIKAGKIKRDKNESVIFRRDNSHYEKRGSEEVCIDKELPFDIPENWSWCRLSELCTKIGAGSTPTGGKAVYVSEGIKFIRSQNVYNDGLRLNDIAYITGETNSKKLGSIVQAKDILLNITGGSIGRCAIVPDDFDIANVNQHVMIIRLVDPTIRRWIHAILISEYIQNLIMDVQVGVSREGLSATKLMNFLIPLPPICEQNRILDFCANISNRLSSL